MALGLSVPAALGVTNTSQAQEPEEAAHIEYAVPPGCPSEDAFRVQVRARTSRLRETADATHARTFLVSIARADHSVSGHLVVRSAGDGQLVRDVAGNRCEDVVAAMALIVALDLDPNAATSSLAASTVSSQQAANVPGPEHAPERARATASSAWSMALGIHAALDGGPAPRPLIGAWYFVEAGGPPRGFFAPTVRVAFERATSAADAAVPGPTASFTWTAGMVEACPARWTSGSSGISPCLRMEAGVIEATGANIDPVRSPRRPWLAAGVGAEGRWFFFTPLFFDAEVGARFHLYRTRYFFQPDITTYYETPLVGWTAGAGVGMLFL
jgi:hypothetical protein